MHVCFTAEQVSVLLLPFRFYPSENVHLPAFLGTQRLRGPHIYTAYSVNASNIIVQKLINVLTVQSSVVFYASIWAFGYIKMTGNGAEHFKI